MVESLEELLSTCTIPPAEACACTRHTMNTQFQQRRKSSALGQGRWLGAVSGMCFACVLGQPPSRASPPRAAMSSLSLLTTLSALCAAPTGLRPSLGYVCAAAAFMHLALTPLLAMPVPGGPSAALPLPHTLWGAVVGGGWREVVATVRGATADPGLTWYVAGYVSRPTAAPRLTEFAEGVCFNRMYMSVGRNPEAGGRQGVPGSLHHFAQVLLLIGQQAGRVGSPLKRADCSSRIPPCCLPRAAINLLPSTHCFHLRTPNTLPNMHASLPVHASLPRSGCGAHWLERLLWCCWPECLTALGQAPLLYHELRWMPHDPAWSPFAAAGMGAWLICMQDCVL